MNLFVWTSPGNTTNDPLPVARDGAVRIVPRHIDTSVIDLAREYGDYADDPDNARAIRDDGPTGAAVEAEATRRWEDFLDAVAPTFTNREDATAFAARLIHAIDTTWPQP